MKRYVSSLTRLTWHAPHPQYVAPPKGLIHLQELFLWWIVPADRGQHAVVTFIVSPNKVWLPLVLDPLQSLFSIDDHLYCYNSFLITYLRWLSQFKVTKWTDRYIGVCHKELHSCWLSLPASWILMCLWALPCIPTLMLAQIVEGY